METLGAIYFSYEKKAKSTKSVGSLVAQFSQKLFMFWSSDCAGSKAKNVSFVINTIWAPYNK